MSSYSESSKPKGINGEELSARYEAFRLKAKKNPNLKKKADMTKTFTERRKKELEMLAFLRKQYITINNMSPQLAAALCYAIFRIYIEMGEGGPNASLHAPDCAARRLKELLRRVDLTTIYLTTDDEKNKRQTSDIRIYDSAQHLICNLTMIANLTVNKEHDVTTTNFELHGDNSIFPFLKLAHEAYPENNRVVISPLHNLESKSDLGIRLRSSL